MGGMIFAFVWYYLLLIIFITLPATIYLKNEGGIISNILKTVIVLILILGATPFTIYLIQKSHFSDFLLRLFVSV